MIRLGLVGIGPWGRNYVRVIEQLPGVRLAAVCKRSAEQRPAELSCDTLLTSDFGEAVAHCDALIIATPPNTHVALAKRCLEAGRPVLVEKPVAESLSDTTSLFAAAARAGLPVLVNNIQLFSPAFLALRSAALGWGPLEGQSHAGNLGPFRSYSALLDWGPHDVGMALSLERGSLRSHHVVEVPGLAPGRNFHVQLEVGRSAFGLTFGNGMPVKERWFEVRGGGHVGRYTDYAADRLHIDGRSIPVAATSPLELVVQAFVRYIATGDEDWRFSPELNRSIMEVLVGEPAAEGAQWSTPL